MFPWGAIVSLAGTAASGIMSALNNRQSRQNSNDEYARQQAEMRKRANEDPLTRSDNQQILGQYDRSSEKQLNDARSRGVVTGETAEAAAARQKAVAEGRADMMSNMSARAAANRDYYLKQEEQSKRNQYLTEQQRLAARNQTYANLASNAANAFGNIVSSYGTPKVDSKKSDASVISTTQGAAKIRTGVPVPTNFVEKKTADAYIDPTNLVQQAEDELKNKKNISNFRYPISIFTYPKSL